MQAFNTKTANNGTTPDGQLTAVEFNQIADELEGAITRSGQTLSAAKLIQLARAMSITALGAHAMQDGGVANAYVLTPITGANGLVLPEDYTTMNGAQITFVPGNANSGPATINIGQSVGALLGTKKLLAPSGAELRAGDLVAGVMVECTYDQTADSGAGAWLIFPEASLRGFGFDGTHDAYTGDLDAIARNSLYAVQQGQATHLPEDMAAGAWGYVQTMVLPGDTGRTQVLWSQGDPDRPGWWRRRAAGVWSDWRLIGSGSGMPVGSFFYYPGTTAPAGAIAINDGPELSRATWPDLWEFAQNSGLLLTEAEWQAQAAVQSSVGFFSDGDGSTTFRLPRLRDFVRGADPSGGRPVGMWQADLIKEHKVGLQADRTKQAITAPNTGNNANSGDGALTWASNQLYGGDVGATETRPKSVSWLPCIQAANVPVNAGTVNMLELASEVAGKVDRSEWVELVPDQAWKLPNGLILQIGKTAAVGINTVTTVTLPVTCPTAGLLVLATPYADNYVTGAFVAYASFVSVSQIKIVTDEPSGTTGTLPISWLVLCK